MFAGQMARGPYARAALVRIGLFSAATIAFPFVLYGIGQASNCHSIAGACGAVGLVVSIGIKPLIYLVFIASFVGISIKRLRDLQLPLALIAVLPIMMLADFSFGVILGAPWSLGFVLGAIGGWPRDLFAALVCIAFLCVTPSAPEGIGARRWGYAGAAALGVLLLLTLGAVLSLIRGISLWFANFSVVLFSQSILKYYSLYGVPILFAFVLLLGLVSWQQRRHSLS